MMKIITPAGLGVTGLALYLILLMWNFGGYVLPMGQMAFWIVSSLPELPWLKKNMSQLLQGGFAGFALYPIILTILVALHVRILHLGENWARISRIDILVIGACSLLLLSLTVGQMALNGSGTIGPVGHNILNPLATPPHIRPDWHILPAYSIFRAIPSRSLAIWIMAAPCVALTVLAFWPQRRLDKPSAGALNHWLFWFFVAQIAALGVLGSRSADATTMLATRIVVAFLFLHIFIALPRLRSFTSGKRNDAN